jgi:hypothetical protein
MGDPNRPVLILTAICDASARPAAITRGHGDAMERAYRAAGDAATEAIEIVELPIPPLAFAALRKHVQGKPDSVTVYDLFPLSSQLDARFRAVAGQFLAAEALWALEAVGVLGGVPLRVQLDVPKGWSKDPKELRDRLVAEHALELGSDAVRAFEGIKARWEASAPRT